MSNVHDGTKSVGSPQENLWFLHNLSFLFWLRRTRRQWLFTRGYLFVLLLVLFLFFVTVAGAVLDGLNDHRTSFGGLILEK